MKDQNLNDKILGLLAEKYPNKEIIFENLIHLKSQLHMPKGTEHFMSDLHGEYDAFFHIINNCSGVIREKVDYLFGNRMSAEDRAEFCTLIYYPAEKIEQIDRENKLSANWYLKNLARLLELSKFMSCKYPSPKVRSFIPEKYTSVISALMSTRPEEDPAQKVYHENLLEAIVSIRSGTEFIEAFTD